MLSLSAAGYGFISTHEGTRHTAYQDVVNVYTICQGHTKGVKAGDTATDSECRQFLQDDVAESEQAVRRLVKVPVTQEQYSVLVDFTFNLGAGALAKSTLLKKLNAGDCVGASVEFLKWDKAGGKVQRGLHTRRSDEAAAFKEDC